MSEDRGGGGRSPGVGDHEHVDTQPWQAYAAATRPAATSSYRGVCLHKRSGRWQAAINVGGKHVYLGSFDTQEAAARQFDQVCLRVRGPAKAKLNFPLQDYVGPDGEALPHPDPRLRQLVQEASSALTRRLKGQQGDEGHGHDDVGSGSKAGGAKRCRLESAGTAPAPASAAAGGGGGGDGDRGGYQVSAESALMSRLGLGASDGLGRASAESLGLGLAPASGSAGGLGLGLGLMSGRSEGFGGGAGGMGALLRDNGGGSDLGRLLMLAAQPQGSGAASAGRLRDPPALGGASGAGACGGRSVGALEALAPSLQTSRVAPPPARTEALLEALLRSELVGRQELGAGVGRPSGPGSLEGALLQALLRRELGPGGPREDGNDLSSAPPPQEQQQRSGFPGDSLQVLSRLGLGMGNDAQLAAAALRRREDAEAVAAAAPAAEADLLRRLLAALLPGSQPAATAAGGNDASRSPRAPRSPVLDHHSTRNWDSAAALTGSAQPTLASATAAAPRPAPPAPPPSAEAAQAQLIGGLLGSFHQHLPAGAVLDALVPATRDLLGYTYMLPPAATRSGDAAGRGPGGSESPASGSARPASIKAEGATWSGAGPAHTEGAGRAGRTAGAGIYTQRGVFRDLGSYTTPEDALQACQASLSALLDAGRLLPPHEDAANEPPAPAPSPAPVHAPAAAARAKTGPEVQAPPGPSHPADAHTASAAGAAAGLLELALAGTGGSTAELLARLNELSRLPEAGHSDTLPRQSELSLPPPRALRQPPASPPPGRGLQAGGIPAFGEGCSGSLPPAKPSQGGVRLGPVGLQLLAAQLASASAPQQHHQPQPLLIKPLNVERPSWGSTEENTLNDQQPADPQPGLTDAARAYSGNGRDGSGSGGGSPSSSGLVPGGDARSRLKRPLSRSSGGGASPAISSPHKTSSGVPGEWRAVHAAATTVSRPGLGAGLGGVARAEGREVSGLRASSPRHSGGSANRAGSLPHPSAAAGSCACSTGACIAITA
ncbi:hypothetical protein HYH03_006144 [Edaphochlamys debaryana]|uniref:AP2/ERF domain-containing protein n=1 Tax=Edaphochlamys debaryana TaxID=47281 RepID=A0A835Y6C3_9CHLO|nr:hypothetical protein HYH03_006144 [Edaphochlamys debaryana]|eukprot:KAG2495907.1 hypothetical protein HYH03_006144 [Edaphochlamys debaryana]